SFNFVRISRVDVSHSHLHRLVSKKRGQRKHVHSSLRSPSGVCVPEIVKPKCISNAGACHGCIMGFTHAPDMFLKTSVPASPSGRIENPWALISSDATLQEFVYVLRHR